MLDAARLLSRATSAFVDRTPIDWHALLARARPGTDRSLIRNLLLLDSFRALDSSATASENTGRGRASWAVLIASTIQTACAAGIVLAALLYGDGVGDRPAQVALTAAFAIAGALLYVSSRDPRRYALLAWFAAIASLFARSAAHGLPPLWFSSIDFLFSGVLFDAFAPACLWQFALSFPRVRRFTRFDVIAGRTANACWVLGLSLFAINLLGTYSSLDSVLPALMRTHASNVYWQLLTLAMIPAIGVILARSRRAPPLERTKVVRFAAALSVGTAPFLLVGVIVTLSPDMNRWLTTADPSERLWLDRLIVGSFAVTPILATIAIVVDRPFELHAFLGLKSVVVLARGILTVAPLAVLTLLAATLYEHRDMTIAQLFSSETGVPLLLCAATAGVLFATRARLLSAFDRFASRRAAEHQAQLARALERIRLARGAREVVGVLESELRHGTGAEAVAVLRPTASGDFVASSQSPRPLSSDTALVAILGDTDSPVDVSEDGPLLALLPPRDRAWLAANNVSLLAAVKHRDEAMAAVIAIGPKHGGLSFDQRDRWLIATLAAAAATWNDGSSPDTPDAHGAPASLGMDANDAALECPRCGLVSDTPTLGCSCGVTAVPAALPRLLADEFLVECRLGAGGMGVVYRARDVRLGRDVALKTLPALKPGSIARLRDEAHAMAALNHPSLAVIYGLELWRRTPVLVVEYLPNGTLAHTLAGGALEPVEMIPLGIALARALAYMHLHGVLHRDLKPSNIGFTATGAPKLLDFGLAELIEPALLPSPGGGWPSAGVRVGTRAYLPPEAFHGALPTAEFDLWALSLVLWEAVVGVSSRVDGQVSPATRGAIGRGTTDAIITTPLMSPAMRTFFDRALNREPARRFATASEILRALELLPR